MFNYLFPDSFMFFVFGVSSCSKDVLSASNGTSTGTGLWIIINNNTYDDNLDDVAFLISYASPANFAGLSEDLEILPRSASKIGFKHVSGGNG